MGWEVRGARRYYTRTRRAGGRLVREYVGTGPVAEMAAAADAVRQAQRRAEAEARRAERARWETALAPLEELCLASDLLVRASLTAAGYHQHDRGEWRRRHVSDRTGDRGPGAGGP